MANLGVIEGAIHLPFCLIMSWLTYNIFFGISSSLNNNKSWSTRIFPIIANTCTHYVFPTKASARDIGSNSSAAPGSIVIFSVVDLYIGVVRLEPFVSITFCVDNIATSNAKQVYVEHQTSNNLADTSGKTSFYNRAIYQVNCKYRLNTAFESVSSTLSNVVHLDSTTYDNVYGSGNGRSIFQKRVVGDIRTRSLTNSSITYSANRVTKHRIGFLPNLSPASSRADFSKVCMRVVLYYSVSTTATYELTDPSNSSYGLQNLTKPWIGLYDPTSSIVDFFLFLYRPKNLILQKDESGLIVSLTFFPENGTIYHGQITFVDLTLDFNSNSIPNHLEAGIEGSLNIFLESYGMVTEYDS